MVNGKRTEESPILHVGTKIQKWEDFTAEVSIDPFEHVDLPGYVFTADEAIIDLASGSNHTKMGSFPRDINLRASVWQR